MYKFTDQNQQLLAVYLVKSLRVCIVKLAKLSDAENRSKISLSTTDQPDFKNWLIAISFMTRKICSRYLGKDDYDFNFSDIKITFVRKQEASNEQQTT